MWHHFSVDALLCSVAWFFPRDLAFPHFQTFSSVDTDESALFSQRFFSFLVVNIDIDLPTRYTIMSIDLILYASYTCDYNNN